MSRGKYAAKAANRRAELNAANDLAGYQKRIAQLIAENKALKAKATETERAHRSQVQRLVAERDEGLSPMLSTLEQENKRLAERADLAERGAKKTQRIWERASDRMISHFETSHGMTGLEATEEFVRLVTADGSGATLVDGFAVRALDKARREAADRTEETLGEALQPHIDRVRNIQRARGERR